MYVKGSIEEYLNDLAARKPAPGGGSAAALQAATGVALMSMVANAAIDGVPIPDPVVFGFFRQLMNAAGDTSYNGFSNLMVALLSHPEQWRLLLEDRSLVPAAIDEALRWEPPVCQALRTPVNSVEIAGVRIEPGDLIGFSLSAVCGVALGVLIGQSTFAYRGLDPIFQVLRTVPPLAWLPIALAAFRDSQPSAIFVIFITSVWPIIINTAVGIRNIPQDYRNVALVLQLNPIEFFWKIMIPSAAPYIFTGLRIGIGLSWLSIVAAEMLTGGVGIGFWVWDEWNNLNVQHIIIAIFTVGVVGLLLEQALILAARRFSYE